MTQQKQKRIESISARPDTVEYNKNRKYPLRHQKGYVRIESSSETRKREIPNGESKKRKNICDIRKVGRKEVRATRRRESFFTIPNRGSKKRKYICDKEEQERKRKDCRKEKEA